MKYNKIYEDSVQNQISLGNKLMQLSGYNKPRIYRKMKMDIHQWYKDGIEFVIV
jgi:hypothetical protein